MTIIWLDNEFGVYGSPYLDWTTQGGLYLFVGLNQQGQLYPVYVGRTASLAARLPTHEKWQEAVLAGASQVHVRVVEREWDRVQLETALYDAYRPQLNERRPS